MRATSAGFGHFARMFIFGGLIHCSINMVMPLALLEKTVDKRISLLLKDGRVLEGKLTGYDEYMNMVLEEVTEKTVTAEERRLGTVVLRGNNVVSISLL